MECKIVTIGLSRDDSPKRRSIRVTENSVRVSSDDGTTKGTLWPSLRAICEWRMYVIRFIFEASDRISHTYEESYDVKIKFIVITKAWKGDLVNKSALPVRLSTLWIIKLTMCPSYEFFNTCFRPRPWIWTHKTTRVTTCTLCGPNTINSIDCCCLATNATIFFKDARELSAQNFLVAMKTCVCDVKVSVVELCPYR
mgnify:CR=1 FL=1